MKKSRRSVKFAELFCGAGGSSLGALLGAADAGLTLKHCWAVDRSADAIATYQQNLHCDRVLVDDVREVDFAQLPKVDGLAFGFPCNDFSVVGEHLGINGDYGPLYRECVRAVRALSPSWFVAENVGGLRSANGGSVLPVIIAEFADLGYSVVPHLFRFEKYEVPQARHRVFLVGIRDNIGKTFRVPAPFGRIRTAREALEKPPIPAGAANHEYTKQSPVVVARLNAISPGSNVFAKDLPVAHRLNVKGARISQIYRRLDPDLPSYTVTGSGGGGTHVYHWAEPRALTNRERARLQTFPDDFIFLGGKESVRKQIGMAVPPLGARVIFRALFKTLQDEEYPAVAPNLSAFLKLSPSDVQLEF